MLRQLGEERYLANPEHNVLVVVRHGFIVAERA
jgi:hypothetical protein